MKVWLNGCVVPRESALVSVFDRGYLFGDGVYEVLRYFNGRPLDMEAHVRRLERSLALARMTGFDARSIESIGTALLEANEISEASFYVQVTRGVSGDRSHIPPAGIRPGCFAYVSAAPPLGDMKRPDALRAAVMEDPRWRLCSIKTTSLMGNVMCMMAAAEVDADEAILHRGGHVGEGSHTNVFLVRDGVLATTPLDDDPPILHGVARIMVLEAARKSGVSVEIRPIGVEELPRADEVFITSSRKIVAAIVALDGAPLGDGSPGPVTTSMFEACRMEIARRTGAALERCPAGAAS